MGLYLVVATRDLTAAVTALFPAFYMPLRRCALVAYDGGAGELARRLDLGCSGGPGILVTDAGGRVARVAASLAVALISLGVLT
ncbi:hypothetical protein [Dongia sp.]|uniref:hypothetical protein n=1 Tax=Dongia sp. TaxID=1977262 RepID=UPI003752A636